MGKRRSSRGSKAAGHNRAAPTEEVDSLEWREARDCAADVRALIGDGRLNNASAMEFAERWGVSRATVWRRVRRFRRDRSLRAFLAGSRGRHTGGKLVGGVVEDVIKETAREWWHRTENATIAEIYPSVVSTCKARGLSAPSRATVARRLALLRTDPANFKGDVRKALQDRSRLVKARYSVTQPLAVVQIDHTVADVFVVDPVSRRCIGRPTLTVAIDIATRSVLGCCLSLEAPSVLLVALCLENAVFPKADWLARIGVDVMWPMHGLPIALHSDNGREFHSAGFRRGCDLNGIDAIYRPPATPRFGGHIERLIGTLMRRVRLLPGSTYSDLLAARPRRAEAKAALTLADLRGFLVEDIARYHTRRHRTLGMTPQTAWDAAWSRVGPGKRPRVPSDPLEFRCEFLPLQRRVVGREGIELFRLNYSSDDLIPELEAGIKRVVRYDPRDLSRVYLERERATPIAVPLRDPRIPPVSLWEWNALRRKEPEVVDRGDGDRVRRSLTPEDRAASNRTPKSLQARRRAARKAAWREVQAIAALPASDIALQPTLTSNDVGAPFAWEVLE